MPEIRNFLALCTCHLDWETMQSITEALEDKERFKDPEDWRYWLIGAPWEYGAWLWVGNDDEVDMPECLVSCLRLARDHGCDWIQFDADTDPIDELPQHAW